jgi:hypothetical protein
MYQAVPGTKIMGIQATNRVRIFKLTDRQCTQTGRETLNELLRFLINADLLQAGKQEHNNYIVGRNLEGVRG